MRNMHCDGWTGDYSAICSFTSLAKGKNKGENHISWGENDTSISTESLFSLLSFVFFWITYSLDQTYLKESKVKPRVDSQIPDSHQGNPFFVS